MANKWEWAGDVAVGGHLSTPSADAAGIVTILFGNSSQAVFYVTPFTSVNAPIVVVAALDFDPSALGGVWVTNDGTSGNWTGFTIHTTNTTILSPPTPASFDYVVVGN
jgi:hypothetical protein